jgi:hypothetical protein
MNSVQTLQVKLMTKVEVKGTAVTWDVVQLDKQATRLPEAGFFSFIPAVDPKGWELTVLGRVLFYLSLSLSLAPPPPPLATTHD